MESVEDYEQIGLKYNFTTPKSLEYRHSIVTKHAHRLYIDSVKA